MTSYSPNHSFKILFLLAILIVSIAAGCVHNEPRGNGPIINLPPAETPVIETIYDPFNKLIAPMHASGWYEIQPGSKFELRLRAIWPSDIQVKIEDQALPKVTDDRNHPELDSSGYYRVADVQPIHVSDPRFFWRVVVTLPLDKRGDVDFLMTIHDISMNQDLTGREKEALPLQIPIRRTPLGIPKPSSVFLGPPDIFGNPIKPDSKHVNSGVPNAFIADNITLAGWLVHTPERNPVDGTEDWHYNIWLDNAFIERNYSATTRPLDTASIPGRSEEPKMTISLTGGGQPNASTFLMPGSGDFTVELNAWHKSKHNGLVPQGWWSDPEPIIWPDVFWPFPVMAPGTINLQAGDYVIITGALVEDSGHLYGLQDAGYWTRKCWDDTFKGHGGWLEIHPVDSIRHISKKQEPGVRTTPRVVQVCRKGLNVTPYEQVVSLAPIPSEPPSANSILRFREIIDGRLTDMSTVRLHTVEITPYDPLKLKVSVMVNPGEGHFMATYLLWWEEASTPRPTAIPYPPDVREPDLLDEYDVCRKKRYLPQCELE